jgi:hypothetical protein
MTRLDLHFDGPFSWRTDTSARCIFSETTAKHKGLYLWTIPLPEGHLVYYIGETGRSFASRHKEHLREHMAGFYHLFEPTALADGRKQLLWNGMYGRKTRESLQDLFSRWGELAPVIEKQTKIIQFFLAPCDVDINVRREIERELASHFSRSESNFQDSGIWYRGAEAPISLHTIEITSSTPIIDLPARIEIGLRDIEKESYAVFITQ